MSKGIALNNSKCITFLESCKEVKAWRAVDEDHIEFDYEEDVCNAPRGVWFSDGELSVDMVDEIVSEWELLKDIGREIYDM
jgi:Zn-finger nucleic acid-binding protein